MTTTTKSTLELAIIVVTKATEKDIKKEYEESVLLYSEANQLFIEAKEESLSEDMKNTIENKRIEYFNRMCKLKKFLGVDETKKKEVKKIETTDLRRRKLHF